MMKHLLTSGGAVSVFQDSLSKGRDANAKLKNLLKASVIDTEAAGDCCNLAFLPTACLVDSNSTRTF
jgi:hypothetical protein